MKNKTGFWIRLSLISLLIVAILGTLMRYKIAFPFPWFDQKSLQHAHSHFAFSGWISQTLFVLMVARLFENGYQKAFENYRLLLWANLVCSYGMLVSFWMQGYGPVSIALSTTSVFISFLFAWVYNKDLTKWQKNQIETPWFRAALFFMVFSSIGTFALAWMMATYKLVQQYYLGSVYFYLHFQYNGWFFFAGLGLFFSWLSKRNPNFSLPPVFFSTWVAVCFLTFFLSTLWARLPLALVGITAMAALLQVVLWFFLLKKIIKFNWFRRLELAPFWRFIFYLLAVCLTAKFLLQLGSVVPEVSRLAFGFRQIVIAYLHLVLLAISSVFLLAFAVGNQYLEPSKSAVSGFVLFLFGVYANEIVLGIQGIASFTYTPIPFANEILFAIGLLMVFGLIQVVFKQKSALS